MKRADLPARVVLACWHGHPRGAKPVAVLDTATLWRWERVSGVYVPVPGWRCDTASSYAHKDGYLVAGVDYRASEALNLEEQVALLHTWAVGLPAVLDAEVVNLLQQEVPVGLWVGVEHNRHLRCTWEEYMAWREDERREALAKERRRLVELAGQNALVQKVKAGMAARGVDVKGVTWGGQGLVSVPVTVLAELVGVNLGRSEPG